MTAVEAVAWVSQGTAEDAATEADVNAVIGQAGVRHVGQNRQIIEDNSGLTQFRHGVEATAAQHLMAELHVMEFFFSQVPSRQTWTHIEVTIEAIGYQIIEMLLAQRRMR